jgi:hypothetical protein
MRKRRIRLTVMSRWPDGSSHHYQLDEVVSLSLDNQEAVEKEYLGRTFKGRFKVGDRDEITDLPILGIDSCRFFPVEVFLSPKSGLMQASRATVTFGDYGTDNPLSNATFEFSLGEGEGLSSAYEKVSSRGQAFLVTTRLELGEVWWFPKAEWDLYDLPQSNVDYTDASSFLWAEILFGIPKDDE